MMDKPQNPVRAARRKVELSEELGQEEVRCIYCGNADPLVVRLRRIQAHHNFGRERDEMTVYACLNCHAVAHERLLDADIPMTCEEEPNKFACSIFGLLAVHFSMMAEACKRFAKRMK
jgi:DNA-directed RNA polymerase subunit RPC12/RpoP